MADKHAQATPSSDEMEAKRQSMIKSFITLSDVMQTCVLAINDYVAHSPEGAAAGFSEVNDKKRKLDAVVPDAAADTSKKGSKKEKKVRDPNQPKRPPSAYLAYQNTVREELSRNEPNIPYKALMGMIAEKWKNLSPEEKKPYEDRYKELNGQWREDVAKYASGQPTSAQQAQQDQFDSNHIQAALAAAAAEAYNPATTTNNTTAAAAAGDSSDSEKTVDESSSESSSEEEESEDELEPAAPPPAPPVVPITPVTKKSKKNSASAAAATPVVTPAAPTPVAAPKSSSKKEKKEKKSKKDKKSSE